MSWKQYKAGRFTKVGSCYYYYCLINHPSPPSSSWAICLLLCLFHGEWRVGFLDFLASCPFPTSAPKPLCPSLQVPRETAEPAAEGGGRPPFLTSLAPGIRALGPQPPCRGAGRECPGQVLQGLKEAAAGLLAGSGKGEGGGGAPVARPPPPGEGAGRAAPSLSCSWQAALRPLPAWTQGSLTPSSRQTFCQPQLWPHHCPPPLSCEPRHPSCPVTPLPER